MDVQAFGQATRSLRSDIGRCPTLAEWPSILWTAPAGEVRWRGPYMRDNALPIDPWGQQYVFVPDGQSASHCGIYSRGVNGVDEHGANDDVSSWSGFANDAYFPNATRDRILGIAMMGGLLVAVLSAVYLVGS
ncbi:hypothetical protein B1810_14305 [Panacagrimonas perspica]|nr:hypothetical protein B1810_14305 [Panacagrimonas perspica]